MVCSVTSLGLRGVAGYPVAAECALSGGLPAFDVVGLPDAAVKEARRTSAREGRCTTCPFWWAFCAPGARCP